jgi:hypothetical protein
MFEAGLLTEEMLDRARQELATWYTDPRAFCFWATVFDAGRA